MSFFFYKGACQNAFLIGMSTSIRVLDYGSVTTIVNLSFISRLLVKQVNKI